MNDAFDLNRFVEVQQGCYETVLSELSEGKKRSHWMWFVFPQLKGLGSSETSQLYGIASLAEAQAYLRHPGLGLRLRECVAAVNEIEGVSAHEIFGSPDDLKFKSCLTLFAVADPDEPVFADSLQKFFAGERDARSLDILRALDSKQRR